MVPSARTSSVYSETEAYDPYSQNSLNAQMQSLHASCALDRWLVPQMDGAPPTPRERPLKSAIQEYPDEVLNGITQAAYAIDKARNRFSEAHFGSEAASWLATYVRDLVNTHIRLLLHFM